MTDLEIKDGCEGIEGGHSNTHRNLVYIGVCYQLDYAAPCGRRVMVAAPLLPEQRAVLFHMLSQFPSQSDIPRGPAVVIGLYPWFMLVTRILVVQYVGCLL